MPLIDTSLSLNEFLNVARRKFQFYQIDNENVSINYNFLGIIRMQMKLGKLG